MGIPCLRIIKMQKTAILTIRKSKGGGFEVIREVDDLVVMEKRRVTYRKFQSQAWEVMTREKAILELAGYHVEQKIEQ